MDRDSPRSRGGGAANTVRLRAKQNKPSSHEWPHEYLLRSQWTFVCVCVLVFFCHHTSPLAVNPRAAHRYQMKDVLNLILNVSFHVFRHRSMKTMLFFSSGDYLLLHIMYI